MGLSSWPPPNAAGTVRTVSKANTASQTTLALSYTAGAGAFGSWAQVVASSAVEYYVVGVVAHGSFSGSAGGFIQGLQVGIGGAGSEVTIGEDAAVSVYSAGGTTNVGYRWTFQIPLRISSGTRISVRGNDNNGFTPSMTGYLIVVPFTGVEGN